MENRERPRREIPRQGGREFQQNSTFPLTFPVDMKQPITLSRITLDAGDDDTDEDAMSMEPDLARWNDRADGSAHPPRRHPADTDAMVWWAIVEMNVFP